MVTVRPETPDDVEGIRRINTAAFETTAQARLIDLLRIRGKLVVSLVAESGDELVGHIAFSLVSMASCPERRGVALDPMAVLPAMQKRGIGSALVRAGLDRCRDLGYDYAVVVGHPEYYPRFGFVPADRFGLSCTWPVPEDVFMALELRPDALAGAGGLVTYEAEFDEV